MAAFGEWREREEGERERESEREKAQMGKSIRVCEKLFEWLAFPHWSSKGYFTPKSMYWSWHSAQPLGEGRGISAGAIYTVFIFCIRIRVGVGDDQCLFNVAAGIKAWIMGSGAITFYLALSVFGFREPGILHFSQHVEVKFQKQIRHKCKRPRQKGTNQICQPGERSRFSSTSS